MKKFSLFTVDDRATDAHNAARMAEFSGFLTSLAKKRRAYTVTIWTSQDGHERGFCVWHN